MKKTKPVGDEESLIRACLESGRDHAGWVVLADWYDEHGRSDAAHMLRTHAPGFAALAEHLPHAWFNLTREIHRRRAYTWDALCKEAGEALACAARAAGSRANLDEMPGHLTADEIRRVRATMRGRSGIQSVFGCTALGCVRPRHGGSQFCQECRAERMAALTAPFGG
jgi:uncharacterized protein (TIGR02996 family)